jgi:hypothetical protein
VLFSLIECQEARGFDAYVRMGDYIRYLKVIPVVCFIKGDAKSGNALCCRFGGKNCKGRVPRLCLMPMKDLDNPMHDCKWIRALDLELIYEKAAREGETREQKTHPGSYVGSFNQPSAAQHTTSLELILFQLIPFKITSLLWKRCLA